jgi:hypothetical protein
MTGAGHCTQLLLGEMGSRELFAWILLNIRDYRSEPCCLASPVFSSKSFIVYIFYFSNSFSFTFLFSFYVRSEV